MYFLGLDIGSTMTKGVILRDGEIAAQIIGPTGAEHRRLADRVVDQLINQAGIKLEDIDFLTATGYGRLNVPFADKQVTEITCHAAGVQWLFPSAKTVIDIGGQDSKVIKLNKGRVVRFLMNDKCAAGTGRFLEVIAEALEIDLNDIGRISLTSGAPAAISSTCTIFAEQEVVSRLVEGVPVEDILAGIHLAMADRICRMAGKLKVESDVVLTGGGAKNTGLVYAFEEKLKSRVFVPGEPLITGALGAALLASREAATAREKGTPLQKKARRLEKLDLF
jgi:predicted CoA-substrate-specific enzyme activase